jgi:hypothetical protein
LSWADANSDINFYDSSLFSLMTGVTYRFGNLPQRRRQQQAAVSGFYRRLPVVPGFLGAYPNVFLGLDEQYIEDFVVLISTPRDEGD